ncbi:efflux RND transporter permease subunit [Jiella sp. MQZ9-1]|uniref:Efflux RND transporter permease subunit n=1 Tax=Jiella flava TaxID=2816857 RepID=A0A939JWX9_9HYPH|nr:efflux RND transporter permease subunit [Jiella flava]MBO0663994.1 efflux RND transporter permease subunit [Jiella flava]MCD2472565.1 efflux RND transporter permease subunit [Jiella flava]
MSEHQRIDGLTAFTSLFIRRPVLTIVLNILIVVAGLAALQAVEVRELPNVDRPVVTVTVTFEGASPETIDRQVTGQIESAVARVTGIESMSSRSSFGTSRVTIEFTDKTDLNVAASDVRDAVSRIANSLPDGADEPRVVKADADADPIMRLAVTAKAMKIEDLTTLVEDRVADQLAAVDGVADVQEYGEREKLIYVDIDPDKLATRGLTIGNVATALQNAALDVPAGSLTSQSQQLIVRADANVNTPAAFEAIYLNKRTRLGDVASVRFGPDEAASQLRRNGETGIGLGIVRQAGSSTLDISRGVHREVANLNRTLPAGVHVEVTSDDAIFINGALHEVELAIGLAVLIVVAVIFLFLLNLRATIIPAVTMPIALIGVVSFIYLAGFSINILTLLALVLATGMVVDDAIIVLENIVRWRDMGAKPRAAAVIGAREMFFAVVSTTATLAAVFVPISFLPGQAGGLFREFGYVLAAAVVISSFIALTLCPMLAANFLKAREDERRPGIFAKTMRWIGSRLAGLYAVTLRACLAFPVIVIAAAALFSFSAYAVFKTMPQELTPSEDRGVVLMMVNGPQGASLDYTNAQVRKVENILLPYVKGGEATNVFAITGRGGVNRAFMVLSLADWADRARSQQQIVAEINGKVRQIPGVRAFAIQPNSLGIRGGGRGLQFAIAGQNFDALAASADKLVNAMQADGRWGTVRLSNDATQPQLSVVINRARASDLGIDIDGLATAIQAMLDGSKIGETYIGDKEVPIRLISSNDPVNDPSDLSNIFLKASDGRIVPMSTVATIEEKPIAPTLEREDRSRAVAITAAIPDGYAIQDAWNDAESFAKTILPADQRLIPLAEAATLTETNSSLSLVFGFAIVVVLLVLAAQFESFISAVIIIATVPLGIACAIFALSFFGESLNLYSQIGLVLLVGIMAKNGILIVEFANQLRERGLGVRAAVEQASLIRLRPVMMTMVATVVGGVPLVFASGAGAEARVALGYVIVGGLGLATFSTLYVTPVAYLILGRFFKPVSERSAELHRDVATAEAEAAQALHEDGGADQAGGHPAPAE